MIREVLIPKLQARFAARGFQHGSEKNSIGFFPAAHTQVGELAMFDDGDEATIYIGQITHLHIDSEASEEHRAEEEIANEVISFLEDLFADKMMIWKLNITGENGVLPVANVEEWGMDHRASTFVWSGPVPNPKRAG